MRALSTLLRGLGLLTLGLGVSGALSVSAQGDATSTPDAAQTADGSTYDLVTGAWLCDAPSSDPDQSCDATVVSGAAITATSEDGETLGSCVTEIVEQGAGPSASCVITVPRDQTVSVDLDPQTIPDGFVIETAPIELDVPSLDEQGNTNPGVFFELIPVTEGADDSVSSSPAPTGQADQSLTSETDGSIAAIYAGNCDTDFTVEPVATLTNVRAPSGERQGDDDASAVETSFTTLDLPLDDILSDDHVLVVFDEDDDTESLACGAIGGIVTEDGTLVFGLPAMDGSRYSGVAYLAEDGNQTTATIFLAEGLNTAPDATPAG